MLLLICAFPVPLIIHVIMNSFFLSPCSFSTASPLEISTDLNVNFKMTIRMQWHLTLSIGKWIRVEWNGEVSASLLFTTGAGYRAQEGMAMLVEKYRNIRETSFAAWKLPLCMKRKRYESMREALCINVWIWNTLKYSLGSAGLQLAQCARNCLNNSLNSAIRISAGPGWAGPALSILSMQ